MKTHDENMFDELIRQKLGEYSESPDMSLMQGIHLKTNRVISLYNLYRLSSIIIIAGAILYGIFMLTKSESKISIENKTNSNPASVVSSNSFSSTNFITPAKTYNYPNQQSLFKNNSDLSSADSTTQNSLKIQTQFPKSTSSHSFNKTRVTDSKRKIDNLNSLEIKTENNAVQKPFEQKLNSEKEKKSTTTVCKAAFEYFISFDGKITFMNFSEVGENNQMTWDFGDGSFSEIIAPIHTYLSKGTYKVVLSVKNMESNCSDQIQKYISFNNSIYKPAKGISIKGRVLGTSDPVQKATVSLFSFNNEKNTYFNFIKTITNLSGEYQFDNLPVGSYMILADANSNQYQPTYWGSTTDQTQAVELAIMENDKDDLSGINILMIANRDYTNSEIVRGNHSDSSSTNTYFLFDSNNNLVKTIHQDNAGNPNLDGLPPGNYNLINQQNGNSTSITIPPGNSAGNNSSNPGSTLNSTINLFPNPAISEVKFNINSGSEQNADITVINSSGSIIFHESKLISSGDNPLNIDISGFPAGEYFVIVTIGGKQTMTGRVIRKIGADY